MDLNKALSSLERRRRLLEPAKTEDVDSPILKESSSRTNLEEISTTPKNIYLNKALSSLEERRRRQNSENYEAMKKRDVNNSKFYSGTAEEDSIIQMMHKLSAEVSHTISPRRRTPRGTSDPHTPRNETPTNRNSDIASVGRGRSAYQRSRSVIRSPMTPTASDTGKPQNTSDQITTSKSDVSNQTKKIYSRARSLSRMREQRRQADEETHELKITISDLSNRTASIHPHGENASKRTSQLEKQLEKAKSQLETEKRENASTRIPELEKQLERVKSQIESEKKYRSQDINRLERQANELLQKLKAVEKEKAETEGRTELKNETINLLREQNTDLKRLVNDLQRQSRDTNKQIAQLEQQIAKAHEDYRSDFELLKNEFESREKEYDLAHEEDQKANENLRNQLDFFKKIIEQRDNDMKLVRDKSSALENEAKELLEENETLHDQLDKLEEKIKVKSNELLEYQNAVNKAQEENKDLMKKMQTMEVNFQRKEEKIKNSVENQLSSLQKDVVKVVGNLKQEKLQKEKQISQLKKTIEDQEQKSKSINEQIVDSRDKVQELSVLCNKMEKMLASYEQKNLSLEDQILEYKKKNQALKEDHEKVKRSFEEELLIKQKQFEKALADTKESFSARELEQRKKMQEKLDYELSSKSKELQDLKREEEKRYAAKEEELRNTFKSQIEKLQAFLEDEVDKAEADGKRSLDQARKKWQLELESKLQQQEESNLEKLCILENQTIKLQSEVISKDTLIKQLKEEVDLKNVTLKEKEESIHKLSKEYHAKETELSKIRVEKAKIQEREEKSSLEHLMELQSSEEAMSRLEQEKDQTIQSLKVKLEKQQAALESLSRQKGEKTAAMKSLSEELEEKERLLESLRRNERELYRSLEEKDNLIQCLAGRLETNQLAVESLSLSLEAREQEVSWTKSQLEESASCDESRTKTDFEEKLAALTAEKNNAIELLEEDLRNVRQQLKSLSSSVNLKNKKILEYEAEIAQLNTTHDTAHLSGGNAKPEKPEEIHNLEGEKIKLEHDLAKMRENLNALQKQYETANHVAKTDTATLNPFESIDRILEQTPVNVILNYLRTHITTQKPKINAIEAQKLPISQDEQESDDADYMNKSSDSTNEEFTYIKKKRTATNASNSLENIDNGFSMAQNPLNEDVQEEDFVGKVKIYASLDRSIEKSSESTNAGKVSVAKDACDIKNNIEFCFSKTQCPSKAEDEREKRNIERAQHSDSLVKGVTRGNGPLNVEKLRTSMDAGDARDKIDFSVKNVQHPGNMHDDQETTDSGNAKSMMSVASTMIMSSDSNNLQPRKTHDSSDDFDLGFRAAKSSLALDELRTSKDSTETKNDADGIKPILDSTSASSQTSESENNHPPPGNDMIQTSESAPSDASNLDVTYNFSMEKFMSAKTPKAKHKHSRSKAIDSDLVEDKIRSALSLWEEKQSFSLTALQDDGTACGTAYGCDGPIPSSQLNEFWYQDSSNIEDNNPKSISQYGYDESTASDNTSLGITTIRSSDSTVSDCTFESHDIAAKEMIARKKLEELLKTATMPSNPVSLESVEEKLRMAIARWENIQTSYHSEQESLGILDASGGMLSATERWCDDKTSLQPESNNDFDSIVECNDGGSDGFYSCTLADSITGNL